MNTRALLLLAAMALLTACNRYPLEPYRNYRITDVEAIPACKVGGAPYHPRNKR